MSVWQYCYFFMSYHTVIIKMNIDHWNYILYLCILFQDTVDVDKFILRQDRVEPYIIVFQCSSVTQYCVIVEKNCLITTDCFHEALASLMPSYFVFNIAYPKPFYSLLLFLQHAVLNLSDVSLSLLAYQNFYQPLLYRSLLCSNYSLHYDYDKAIHF